MFERLRLAYSFKWLAFNFFDEVVDSSEDFFIGFLPIKIILPSIIGKYELQSKRSLSVP